MDSYHWYDLLAIIVMNGESIRNDADPKARIEAIGMEYEFKHNVKCAEHQVAFLYDIGSQIIQRKSWEAKGLMEGC